MEHNLTRRDAIALGVGGLATLAGIGAGIGLGWAPFALADDEGGGGGGHEEGGGEHGYGTDLGWGYAWRWFDELADPSAKLTKDSEFKQGWGLDSANYFWNNLINGPNGRNKEIFTWRATQAAGITLDGEVIPTPASNDFYGWYIDACTTAINNAKRRANSSDARIVGVGWTIGFNKSDGKTAQWYMSTDTPGRTFDVLLHKEAHASYNGHGVDPECHDGYFAVGNGVANLGESSTDLGKAWSNAITVSGVNGANPNEIWRDYIYRMGAKDNEGGSQFVWVVVAVAKGWPAPQSYPLEISKRVTGVIPSAEVGKKFSFRISFFGEGAPRAESFSLADGETKRIEDIPVGVTWSLDEDLPEGYSVEWTNQTGTIKAEVNKAGAVNNAIPGSLNVLKRAEGGNANDVFGFHVRITESKNSDKVILEQDFTLKANQSKLFENLPRDAHYVVKETTGFEHYQSDWNGSDEGDIKSNEVAQATCNNIGNGMLFVTKDLAD